MSFAAELLVALKFGLFNMAWIFALLWGVERLWPKSRPNEWVQLAALRFRAFDIVAATFIVTAFDAVKARYPLSPFVVVSIDDYMPVWLTYLIGPLTFLAIYDFFNYWMHRAQHRWFWAQHSIHHSIRQLSAVNSYFHWTENLFRIAFISIPTALLFDLGIGGVTIVSMILTAMHGNFIHSATALHFGKIGRLFLADNRWHRIHHSIEREHFDKNFGTGVTFWDRLFRTAYYPENDEWPAVGVHDIAEPATVSEYLWRPFQSGEIIDQPAPSSPH